MVIKASASAEIRTLVAALGSADEVRREAAAARLAVLGARAVERVTAAYRSARTRDERLAILRVLEAIGDQRGGPVARAALSEGGDVALAAAAVLRTLLDCPQASVAGEALDTLIGVALDPAAEPRLRLAASDALRGMPNGVHATVTGVLQQDPALGARVSAGDDDAAALDVVWTEALQIQLPDDPRVLREVLELKAPSAAFIALQKLVDAIRIREQSAAGAARASWQSLRGFIHQSLARRGSRVALYDLRESLEQADGPLPVSFLAALQALGDGSCLESVAAAYSRANPADEWWREQLASSFRAIARREKLTRRHAAWKRIVARWPAAREIAATD